MRCQETYYFFIIHYDVCWTPTLFYITIIYSTTPREADLGSLVFITHLSRENTNEQLSTLWIHITKYKNIQHNFTSLIAFTNCIFLFMYYLRRSFDTFVYSIFYKHLVFIVTCGSEHRNQWPWTDNHFVFYCFNSRSRETVSQSNDNYMFVGSFVIFLTTSRFR